MKFRILWKDKHTSARVGVIYTNSGPVLTPAFMPVGTEGAVKGVFPFQLGKMGYRLILSNLYHLYLRPGVEVIEKAGGVSKFMGWEGAVLTDSGGFQIFSLSNKVKVEDKGIHFASHIDGSHHFLSPEDVVEIAERMGPDISMILDHFVSNLSPWERVKDATLRTLKWAEHARRKIEEIKGKTSFFAIVQGGIYKDLRKASARELASMDFDGYGIGGLGVGESQEEMLRSVEETVAELPQEKPRYLMGIGHPLQMARAISLGVDLFDCVIPTRNGRRGQIFSQEGILRIKRREFAEDFSHPHSDYPFSKALLRHLYVSSHLNSALYNTLINLRFFLDIMEKIRKYIKANSLREYLRDLEKNWREK